MQGSFICIVHFTQGQINVLYIKRSIITLKHIISNRGKHIIDLVFISDTGGGMLYKCFNNVYYSVRFVFKVQL